MEEFEGKVIRYMEPKIDIDTDGYVVGCDYDIGITIVENNHKDHYLYCLRWPSSGLVEYSSDSTYEFYNELFKNIIAMLKEGIFDDSILEEIRKKYGGSVGLIDPNSCPFNK